MHIGPRNRGPLGRAMLATLSLALVTSWGGVALGDEENEVRIDAARTTLEKWVEAQRLISREKQDWKLGREMLKDRLEVIQQEIDSLQERIKDAQDNIAKADKKRTDLLEENEQLKEASASLGALVGGLEARTRKLLKRLPQPIRERILPLSQKIPEDPNDTKLSLSGRFQNILGVLNEVNKFHGEISLTSELRELDDGATVEVTALYLGVSQGFYASSDGQYAGFGTASADDWVWSPANHAAPEISRAIAILKNEDEADFVHLPIRIE